MGKSYSATNSVYSLPIAIAEREGLFTREGLDFRVVIPVPGRSDKMIHALHDDTIDITHVATPFLVAQRSRAPTLLRSLRSSTIPSTR